MPTKIPWCRGDDGRPGETINPLGWGCYGPTGSPEEPRPCPYCYAHKQAKRKLRDCPDCQAFRPHYHPEEIEKIKRWKRPRRIFVQSMGDLFGNGVPELRIMQILFWLAAPRHAHHTMIFLTKCAERMREIMLEWLPMWQSLDGSGRAFPPNFWLGASIDTPDALHRYELVRDIPAAVHFISFEPLLEPIDVDSILYRTCTVSWGPGEDDWGHDSELREDLPGWAIIGEQSGRPVGCAVHWAEDLIHQLREAEVPIWVKGRLAEYFPYQESPEVANEP